MAGSDLEALRQQAICGFRSDAERCRAWLALLHLPDSLLPQTASAAASEAEELGDGARTPGLSSGSTVQSLSTHSGGSGSTLLEDAGQYHLDADGWQVGVRQEEEGWQVAGEGKLRRRKKLSLMNGTDDGETDEGSVMGAGAKGVRRDWLVGDSTPNQRKAAGKNARKRKQRAAKKAGTLDRGSGAEKQGARPSSAHRDEQQLDLDINRSFVWMSKDPEGREGRKAQLRRLIVDILRKHPTFNYFQGYHDILSIVLIALSPDLPVSKSLDGGDIPCDNYDAIFAVAERISLHLLRDSLGSTMAPNIGQLKVLRNILRSADPSYAEQIEIASSVPYFALAWVLTWLSHDLDEANAKRVLDFVIAYGPASIVYVAAAIILIKKDAILGMDADELDDSALVHHALQQLPSFAPVPESQRAYQPRRPTAASRLSTSNPRMVAPDLLHGDSDVYTDDFRASLAESRNRAESESDPGDVSDTPGKLVVQMTAVLRKALEFAVSVPLESVSAPLGPKSSFLTWSETFNKPSAIESPTTTQQQDWVALDAQAEAVLSSGDVSSIVRDGAETPPAYDSGYDGEKGGKGAYGTAVAAQRRGRLQSGSAAAGTVAVTLVGVVGVGMALYAAQKGEGEAMVQPARAVLDLAGRLIEMANSASG